MQVPPCLKESTTRHVFAIYCDNYARLAAKDKQSVNEFLTAFGRVSQEEQSHPRNLYDSVFIEKGCVFIFLAECNEVIGGCKFGVKRLYEFANGATHEIISPCLQDVFIFQQHRRKHYFPMIIDAIQQFSGLAFSLFALDDPPSSLITILAWKCSDQASKFMEEVDAITSLSQAYRIAKLRRGRSTFDGYVSFNMLNALADFIPEAYKVQGAPFDELDLGGSSEELVQEYNEYTNRNEAVEQEIRYEPQEEQNIPVSRLKRPVEISEGEYEDFLQFRAERLRQRGAYYQMNERQQEVPMRSVDARTMGRDIPVVQRQDAYATQAEAFKRSEEEALENKPIAESRFEAPIETSGYEEGKVQIVNYSGVRQPAVSHQSARTSAGEVSEFSQNRTNEMESKIHFGGYYGGNEDVYRRKNEFMTMKDLAADQERKAHTEESMRVPRDNAK